MNNPIITVVFSHGKDSSPWHGFKIEALRPVVLKMGINLISISYPENLSIEEMEDKLFDAVKDDVNVPGDLIFLSSSRGAYISTRVAQNVMNYYENEHSRQNNKHGGIAFLPKRNVLGQFLIAPPFYTKPEYYPDQNVKSPKGLKTTIIHGINDGHISFDNSIEFAKRFQTELYLIEGDHRLISQREKLCTLFELFLKECQEASIEIFRNWSIQNTE